ncbi:LysR family transcriptional regulator [Labrys okinawensis]|uniref:LysR family transcriptional regulator n=1 Tax=Labrys okinawensis TaxID=346911 RepID=UPI0039BC519F
MHGQRPASAFEQYRPQASPIDLRQLRYVIAAAEHRSFRRAGAYLNIHPSAISKRIHDLETRLGAILFVRGPSGVEVTPEGREFLNRAQPALEALQAATDTIVKGESRALRIGVSCAISPRFLYALLDLLKTRYPMIREKLFDGESADHLASIRSRRLDVAIVPGQNASPSIRLTRVWSESLSMILPTGHPLEACQAVDFPTLSRWHVLIGQNEPTEEIINAISLGAKNAVCHPSLERSTLGRVALLSQVALGRCLGLCGEATTAISFPGVIFRPIANLPYPVVFSALSQPDNNRLALRRFLEIARTLEPARR